MKSANSQNNYSPFSNSIFGPQKPANYFLRKDINLKQESNKSFQLISKNTMKKPHMIVIKNLDTYSCTKYYLHMKTPNLVQNY